MSDAATQDPTVVLIEAERSLVVEEIDKVLSLLKDRELVSTTEMADLLLDIRLTLSNN